MPETLQPYGVTVPSLDDASAEGIPGQLKTIVRDLEKSLIGAVTDLADRNARFGQIAAGQLVVSWQQRKLWMRTDTGWVTIYSGGRWTTEGITVSDSSVWAMETSGWINLSGMITFSATLRRTSGEVVFDAAGNTFDRAFTSVSVPEAQPSTGYLVVGAWRGDTTGGTAVMTAAGNVFLADGHSGSRIATDTTVAVHFTYPSREWV